MIEKLEYEMKRCSSFYTLKPQIEQIVKQEINPSISIGADYIRFAFSTVRSSGGNSRYDAQPYIVTFKTNEVNIKHSRSGSNWYENYTFRHDYDLTIKGDHVEHSNVHTVWTEDGAIRVSDRPVNEVMQDAILSEIIKFIDPLENKARQSASQNQASFFNSNSVLDKLRPISVQNEQQAPIP